MAAAGPTPGRTPTNVPMSAHRKQPKRLEGCRRTEKPRIGLCRSSLKSPDPLLFPPYDLRLSGFLPSKPGVYPQGNNASGLNPAAAVYSPDIFEGNEDFIPIPQSGALKNLDGLVFGYMHDLFHSPRVHRSAFGLIVSSLLIYECIFLSIKFS